MVEIRNVEALKRAIDGDEKALMTAFTWFNTNQGAHYWGDRYKNQEKLSEADIARMRKWLRKHEASEARKAGKLRKLAVIDVAATPETVTPQIVIREGAWYERRDGKIVGPMGKNISSNVFPWIYDKEFYKTKGEYLSDNFNSPLDIIREVPEPSRTSTVDWSQVGEEIVVFATTHCGVHLAYAKYAPIRCANKDGSPSHWSPRSSVCAASYFPSFVAGNKPWQDSLIVRPGYEVSK